MNSLVRGLPTESIETILTLKMPCKPHSKHKNVFTLYMTSSIRHQFFEFSQGDRPDFLMSNFKKKIILVLSLLSSFKSGLCTKYSKILTRPNEYVLCKLWAVGYCIQFYKSILKQSIYIYGLLKYRLIELKKIKQTSRSFSYETKKP